MQGLVWGVLQGTDEALYELRVDYIGVLIAHQARTAYDPALCDHIEDLIERTVSCPI